MAVVIHDGDSSEGGLRTERTGPDHLTIDGEVITDAIEASGFVKQAKD